MELKVNRVRKHSQPIVSGLLTRYSKLVTMTTWLVPPEVCMIVQSSGTLILIRVGQYINPSQSHTGFLEKLIYVVLTTLEWVSRQTPTP